MSKWHVAIVGGGCLLAALGLWIRPALIGRAIDAAPKPSASDQAEEDALASIAAFGRSPRTSTEETTTKLPSEGRKVPTNAQELAEYVAWMRSLGHDELL